MLDYFKSRKNQPKNSKNDKTFIVILIVFGLIFFANFIAKSFGFPSAVFEFNFSIFDGIILGIILLGYVFFSAGKGRK